MSKIQEPLDSRTQISRRRLLGGLGALSVALTTPIWRVSTAFGKDAGAATAARRFIGLFSANGTIAAEFFPGFSSLVSSSPNKVPAVTQGTDTPLTASSLGRILQPMSAHVSQMIVLQGVDMVSTVSDQLGTMVSKPGGPHMKGPGAMLTGGSLLTGSFQGAGGPAGNADRASVDALIAGRIGGGTPFPSLQFGARVIGGAPLNCISYAAANQPNVPIYDPTQMYSTMFANASLSATQLQQLLADRKSVLDFLQSDIAALETRLTPSDKTRLDAHLTGIRTIEQTLSSAAVACKAPTAPTKMDPNDINNFATIVKVQLDLMVLAHSCGMTNVSTFMFANADSWQYYPFATGNPVGSSPAGANEEHHTTSHCSDSDSANVENLVLMNVWQAQQVNYLLDQLSSTLEPDGSRMLDNSLILWGNELGVGNTHDYRNIPWVVAGGAGGAIKSGRFLQYPNVPHNNLLVSVCNAMGFADVATFGIPGVCTGPLASPSLSG
jgi:Protein of unknown function (DUF1552)